MRLTLTTTEKVIFKTLESRKMLVDCHRIPLCALGAPAGVPVLDPNNLLTHFPSSPKGRIEKK